MNHREKTLCSEKKKQKTIKSSCFIITLYPGPSLKWGDRGTSARATSWGWGIQYSVTSSNKIRVDKENFR